MRPAIKERTPRLKSTSAAKRNTETTLVPALNCQKQGWYLKTASASLGRTSLSLLIFPLGHSMKRPSMLLKWPRPRQLFTNLDFVFLLTNASNDAHLLAIQKVLLVIAHFHRLITYTNIATMVAVTTGWIIL